MVFLTEPVGHCFCPLAAGQKLLPTTVRNQLPLTATFLRLHQWWWWWWSGCRVVRSLALASRRSHIAGSSSQVQPDPVHTFNLNSKIAVVSSFAVWPSELVRSMDRLSLSAGPFVFPAHLGVSSQVQSWDQTTLQPIYLLTIWLSYISAIMPRPYRSECLQDMLWIAIAIHYIKQTVGWAAGSWV